MNSPYAFSMLVPIVEFPAICKPWQIVAIQMAMLGKIPEPVINRGAQLPSFVNLTSSI